MAAGRPVGAVALRPLIELAGVEKTFRMGKVDYPALRGVDLSIAGGEMAVIVGPSGSGKSTILNMITGIDRPTAGTVTFDGQRLDEMSEEALAVWRGTNVGIIFQFFQLLPTLSALENAVLPLDFLGAARSGAVRAGAPQPGTGRSRRQGRPSSLRTVRRGAAAGRDRSLARRGTETARRRRADRQSRHGHRGGDVRAAGAAQSGWQDDPVRDPRIASWHDAGATDDRDPRRPGCSGLRRARCCRRRCASRSLT